MTKNFWQDIWCKLCDNKWKALICAVVAAVGLTVGIALFQTFKYSWWFFNRCAHAELLFNGSFSLIFLFAGCFALFYLSIVFTNLIPQTRFLTHVALFVACLYCGATAAAVVACFSVWGIVYVVAVTVVEVVGYFLSCFLACCEYQCCRTVKEAFYDFRQSFYLSCVAFALKLLCFFVILQVITAII